MACAALRTGACTEDVKHAIANKIIVAKKHWTTFAGRRWRRSRQPCGRRTILQNLSEDIRECLRRAEECKRSSKTALSAPSIESYLDMERRWLSLARSYEFAERLSNFTAHRSR